MLVSGHSEGGFRLRRKRRLECECVSSEQVPLADGNDICMMESRHLYIIGNGFDLYHGAESRYQDFRTYLCRKRPHIASGFDLFFGPWSWYKRVSILWGEFEKNLSELNREKVFEFLDMSLPRVDENEEGFTYAKYYAPLDAVSELVNSCTFDMKYHLHRWVNTLHYKKGFRKHMLSLDTEAVFLNFNYTLFLEKEYGIPSDRICYIHGNRKDRFGSLIFGHHSNHQGIRDRWIYKNQNRRRYRPVQKDAKGRYFKNDKLDYLTYFQDDDESANWRLPIRFYAINEAYGRLEQYYDENYKNIQRCIESNRGFFDSMSGIEKITVIGCSLSEVDMDYYRTIRSITRDDAVWEFSFHTAKDKKRIKQFCAELAIKCVTMFKL